MTIRKQRKAIHEIFNTSNGNTFGNFKCIVDLGDYGTTCIYLMDSISNNLILIEVCKDSTDNNSVSIELHRGISSIEELNNIGGDNQYYEKLNLLMFHIDFPAILTLSPMEQVKQLYIVLEQIINNAIFLALHFKSSYIGQVVLPQQ